MLKLVLRLFLTVFGLQLVFCANAASLNVNSEGQLLGAYGIEVAGTLYDVSFEDGTCAELYSGCDSNNDLPFHRLDMADAASVALLEQVFVDGPLGMFDSSPDLTFGCGDSTFCFVGTPFEVDLGFGALLLYGVSNSSTVDDFGFFSVDVAFDDSTINEMRTYAVWSVSEVPLPGSAWLFGSAIIVGLCRKFSVRR